MPNDTAENTQATMTYPTKEQHARWKAKAEEMDTSLSLFIQGMVEAGLKKFEATVQPDMTNEELRDQRNDLKNQLEQSRQRIVRLEDRLHTTEREYIEMCVRENPGADWAEISQYIADSVPERMPDLLEEMEGNTLVRDPDSGYHLTEP